MTVTQRYKTEGEEVIDLTTNLVTWAGDGIVILTYKNQTNPTLRMAERTTVTFRRRCPAAEL